MSRATRRRSGLAASLLVASLGLASTTASANLLVYEPFDYPAGTASLTGNGNNSSLDVGFGTNLWTTQSSQNNGGVASPGRTYSNGGTLIVNGNTAAPGHPTLTTSRNFRAFGSPISMVNGDTIWIGFIAKAASTGSGHFGVALFSGDESTERATLGKGSSVGATWGISVAAGNGTSATSTVSPTTESFLVYRFVRGATTTAVDMWISPSLASTPLTTDSSWAVNTTMNNTNFDRVRVSTTQGVGGFVDELRIGTTFADVAPVPEPATLGVLALGGLALSRRRRQG